MQHNTLYYLLGGAHVCTYDNQRQELTAVPRRWWLAGVRS